VLMPSYVNVGAWVGSSTPPMPTPPDRCTSLPIIDVTGKKPVETRGEVPPRAIVIPGTRKKKFPAGSYRVPCALVIGERRASTDRKTSLTRALREHAVSV